jgi:RND family efflux transporter MFP subunit
VVATALVTLLVAGGAAHFLGYLRPPGGRGGDATGAGAGEGRVLFYRNPMNPAITSPVPAKDEMGMDYIPVYADASGKPAPEKTPEQQAEDFFAEEGGSGGGAPAGLAAVTLGKQELSLAGVQTAAAVEGEIARTVRTVGRVVPDETRVRRVTVKVGGWVERLMVNATGQTVREGEPLLELYAPELLATQQELLQTRRFAARVGAEAPAEQRAEAERLVAAARRRLELFDVPASFIDDIVRADAPRRAVVLRAPVSGFVTSKGVFAGQQVEPGAELYTVTDLSRVWVEADLYEFDAGAVRVGTPAVLTLPYDPGTRLAGAVTFVWPVVDPESRTLKVRLEFPNPAVTLKPGMFADVTVTLASGRGVTVPESAVIDSGTRQVVFVALGDGRFEPRLVRLGVRGEGTAQVLEGVRGGEQVVVGANFLLDSESRLRSLVEQATAAQR